MLDLLLVNMPIVEGNDPVPGIYYIKSAAEAKGFSATAKDLNAWFKMQNIDLQLITNYFMQHNLVLIDRDCEAHNLAKEYIETYVNENIETSCRSHALVQLLFERHDCIFQIAIGK